MKWEEEETGSPYIGGPFAVYKANELVIIRFLVSECYVFKFLLLVWMHSNDQFFSHSLSRARIVLAVYNTRG
jgi:hypothetical protein